MTTDPVTQDAAPETTMTERMRIPDVVRTRQRTSKYHSRWCKARAQGASSIGRLGHIRMAAEQSVELAIIVINLRVDVFRSWY